MVSWSAKPDCLGENLRHAALTAMGKRLNISEPGFFGYKVRLIIIYLMGLL